MFNGKKIAMISSLLISSFLITTTQAQIVTTSDPSPHFSVYLENRTDQAITTRFKENQGHAYLLPAMNDNTPLAAHQKSIAYGVVFPQLGRDDKFDMILTGKQDCSFTVGFYASGNPSIVIQGPGCFGGGYTVNLQDRYVVLYVTDIHKK